MSMFNYWDHHGDLVVTVTAAARALATASIIHFRQSSEIPALHHKVVLFLYLYLIYLLYASFKPESYQ